MDTTVLGIIVSLGAATVVAYLGLRKKGRRAPVRPVSYRCVGIEPPDPLAACSAVKALSSYRFLPGQAPQIPLPGCTAARCSCKFVHFEDRRARDRRSARGQQVRSLQQLDWAERRASRGRRKTDRTSRTDDARMQAALAEKKRRRGQDGKRSPTR
jgi:hypothetical protein